MCKYWAPKVYFCNQLSFLFFIAIFFQSVKFDVVQVINQLTGWPKIPHSSPSFVKTVTQIYWSFVKFIPHFSNKAISQSTIQPWFKKREDRVSDAPNKYLQIRMQHEVVDKMVEIVFKALTLRQNISLSFLTIGITPLWDGGKCLAKRIIRQIQ